MSVLVPRRYEAVGKIPERFDEVLELCVGDMSRHKISLLRDVEVRFMLDQMAIASQQP